MQITHKDPASGLGSPRWSDVSSMRTSWWIDSGEPHWAAAGGKLATDVEGDAAAALEMEICGLESSTRRLSSRNAMAT